MDLTALATDPRMRRTRLVVTDFEALTPTGRPPEPVEVAAITLLLQADGTFAELDRFTSLMAPPPEVPVTAHDRAMGITHALLASAPSAAHVMTELDRRIHTAAEESGHSILLVAHSAGTERILLHGKRAHCPHLADTALLDTVRLARAALPEIKKHGLSDLASYLGLRIPPDRHRALADVELTVAVLTHLLERGGWSTLLDLERLALMPARKPDAPAAEQTGLF